MDAAILLGVSRSDHVFFAGQSLDNGYECWERSDLSASVIVIRITYIEGTSNLLYIAQTQPAGE